MRCCICDELLTDENKSREHIIHNAIGGVLESDKIYCKGCNEKYGSNEDKEFTKIFAPIVDSFNMVMSRRTDGSSYEGKIIDLEGNIYNALIKNKKVVAAFDKNGTYHKWDKNTDVVICKDFNLDNHAFKMGLAKIAFNYAISLDIKPLILNQVFDNKNKQLSINVMIIPFIPMNPFDIIMESQEIVEPKHILRLFSAGNLLYAYIELFSTFQYYILLSDCWVEGKIYEDYCQLLSKNTIDNDKERQNELKKSLSISDYKDGLILAGQYQINIEDVVENLKKYHGYTGDDVSVLFDKISNIAYEKIRKASYIKSYREQVKLQYDLIDFNESINDMESHKRMKFYKYFQYYTIYDEDSIDIHKYKIMALTRDSILPYPERIIEVLPNLDIKRYCTYKFNSLSELLMESAEVSNQVD